MTHRTPTAVALVAKLAPKFQLRIEDFQVPVELADNFACGGVEGYFTCTAAITTRGLDNNGFVIEVGYFIERVRRAFLADGMLKASCEELAAGVARVAYGLLEERLESIVVEIPNLNGGVRFEWSRGEQIPVSPRRATYSERKRTWRAQEDKVAEESALSALLVMDALVRHLRSDSHSGSGIDQGYFGRDPGHDIDDHDFDSFPGGGYGGHNQTPPRDRC